MRNQLLRDSDWAGMAHGVEIRVPLVDVTLLEKIAPAIPSLASQSGKAALAMAPSVPLPPEIVTRTKTGFGVPTGAWLKASIGRKPAAGRSLPVEAMGLMSRNWSQTVLRGFA
jgi:asparagine synthase (glutamine-hydrolysing)